MPNLRVVCASELPGVWRLLNGAIPALTTRDLPLYRCVMAVQQSGATATVCELVIMTNESGSVRLLTFASQYGSGLVDAVLLDLAHDIADQCGVSLEHAVQPSRAA